MMKKNKKDISPKIKASLENKEVSSYAYQISKIRIDNNLTQMELANILGVSDKTVSSWENGNTTPDSETIKKICSEFGISLSAFVLQKASFKDYIKYFLKCFVKCLDFVWKNILKFIIAILFILLLIYFLNNYNAINMYSLNYDTDDDISLSSGYFIQNKVQNILIINDITITKLDYEIETIDLDLYTLVNGDKVVIYESNNLNDILIDELIEYPVVLKKDIIKSIKKNLHLEINIIDTDNEIHNYEVLIMFKDYFSNNKLIYKDFKSELNNYNTSTYTNQFIANQNYNNNYYSLNNSQEDSKEVENKTSTEEKLKDIGYTYNEETSTYTKTDGIKNIEYNHSNKTLMIKYYIDDYEYTISYYFETERVIFTESQENIISIEFDYYVNLNNMICINGDCENYKPEIDYILKEYELITTTLGN